MYWELYLSVPKVLSTFSPTMRPATEQPVTKIVASNIITNFIVVLKTVEQIGYSLKSSPR